MSERSCLILHRKACGRPEVDEAVRAVRESGVPVEVRIPWDGADVERNVMEALAAGATRIIAGGGDGTVNGVAALLLGDGSAPPPASLGVMPLGTANDFARGCELPVPELTKCLDVACTREARPIDVGMVNGRPFVNVASGGFGAEVTATTHPTVKKALGGAAYTITGLVRARQLRPYPGRLLVPGEEPLDGEMLLMAIGNNRFAGGGFEVAPHGVLDDGLLDLAVVTPARDAPLRRLAVELQDVTADENQYLYYRQLPAFTLDFESDVHINVDGEALRASRLDFSVRPSALEVAF